MVVGLLGSDVVEDPELLLSDSFAPPPPVGTEEGVVEEGGIEVGGTEEAGMLLGVWGLVTDGVACGQGVVGFSVMQEQTALTELATATALGIPQLPMTQF
jgi:hypothetical protein